MKSEINKCPGCGALRTAFSAQCPECGYDFHSTNCKVISDLNNKIMDLSAQGLSASKYDKHLLEIIRSFTIPQIKEEILDLLIFIQPKALQKNSKVTKEWRNRQKEVILRAKMAFSNDAKTLLKVNQYEEELVRLEKQYIRQWWQIVPLLGKVALIVLVLFILLLLIPAKDVSPEAYSLRFAEAIQKEQYDKALKILKKSPDMGTLISEQYLSLIDLLISQGRIMEAESLFSDRGNYVSKSQNQIHLSQTSLLFVNYYLSENNYDKANMYVSDKEGVIAVLKSMIDKGDESSAIKYFKKHSNKLKKYSSQERKLILDCDDPDIQAFALNNNLIR